MKIKCPSCGKAGMVADALAGHTVRCPGCGAQFIPSRSAAPAEDRRNKAAPSAPPEVGLVPLEDDGRSHAYRSFKRDLEEEEASLEVPPDDQDEEPQETRPRRRKPQYEEEADADDGAILLLLRGAAALCALGVCVILLVVSQSDVDFQRDAKEVFQEAPPLLLIYPFWFGAVGASVALAKRLNRSRLDWGVLAGCLPFGAPFYLACLGQWEGQCRSVLGAQFSAGGSKRDGRRRDKKGPEPATASDSLPKAVGRRWSSFTVDVYALRMANESAAAVAYRKLVAAAETSLSPDQLVVFRGSVTEDGVRAPAVGVVCRTIHGAGVMLWLCMQKAGLAGLRDSQVVALSDVNPDELRAQSQHFSTRFAFVEHQWF